MPGRHPVCSVQNFFRRCTPIQAINDLCCSHINPFNFIKQGLIAWAQNITSHHVQGHKALFSIPSTKLVILIPRATRFIFTGRKRGYWGREWLSVSVCLIYLCAVSVLRLREKSMNWLVIFFFPSNGCWKPKRWYDDFNISWRVCDDGFLRGVISDFVKWQAMNKEEGLSCLQHCSSFFNRVFQKIVFGK